MMTLEPDRHSLYQIAVPKFPSWVLNGPIQLRQNLTQRIGFPSFPEGDIRYNDLRGGGFLNDSGCYPICASRMILDEEPISVGCRLQYIQVNGITDSVDVKGTSFLIYENNKSASITFGNGNYFSRLNDDRNLLIPFYYNTFYRIQIS